MLERSGKLFWAEKTPANVMRFGFVRRCFPHSKLIHVIRDGRDAVCSLRERPFGKIGDVPLNTAEAARRCAVMWKIAVKAGLRHRGDPAYYELYYEDLVLDTEPTLRRLCEFLQVPWSSRMVEELSTVEAESASYPPGSVREAFVVDQAVASAAIFPHSIGRWRHHLSAGDIEVLRPAIGPLLVELGYEQGLDWASGRSSTQLDRKLGFPRPRSFSAPD